MTDQQEPDTAHHDHGGLPVWFWAPVLIVAMALLCAVFGIES